jgi:error-prone DNA polymerase
MATFKLQGSVSRFADKLMNGMMKNGYTKEYAHRVFKQLEGFGSYGFPESHAASFALLVYVSSWIKCYYPEVFACALLNSMPMGFYQPAQIVIDARKHGVEVRPVDINYSNWDNLLEEKSNKYCAMRLGFRQVKGLREDDMKILLSNRKQQYKNVGELYTAGLSKATLKQLADADAFRSIGLDRRNALWEVASCDDQPIGMFTGQPSADSTEEKVSLPEMTVSEHVVHDYASVSLSLKAHPVSFVREKLQQLHIVPSKDLGTLRNGEYVKVCGLVLVRQRPGTAKGVCFITIEDETGCANLVVFENILDKYRKEVLQSKLLMVEGTLQREGEVIHIIVQCCYNFSKLLRYLIESKKSSQPIQETAQENIFPEGRNFR